MVHLINHGTFSSNKPNSSGMYLKEKAEDIFVDIDELFRYKLDIESIFMSGCSTGEVQPLKGEEPLGIISYLHSNGVKSAILSSWKIPLEIETTVDVVSDFYRYWLEDGLSRSVALQRAMIRNKKVNPYEYAGFILFGGV
ncbi:MAG: CHAT domain-containing protein [Sulfurovum sp.]